MNAYWQVWSCVCYGGTDIRFTTIKAYVCTTPQKNTCKWALWVHVTIKLIFAQENRTKTQPHIHTIIFTFLQGFLRFFQASGIYPGCRLCVVAKNRCRTQTVRHCSKRCLQNNILWLFSASQRAGKCILKIPQCLILPVLISEKLPVAIYKLKIRNTKLL